MTLYMRIAFRILRLLYKLFHPSSSSTELEGKEERVITRAALFCSFCNLSLIYHASGSYIGLVIVTRAASSYNVSWMTGILSLYCCRRSSSPWLETTARAALNAILLISVCVCVCVNFI